MSSYTGCNGSINIDGQAIIELTGFTIDEATETISEPIMDGECAVDVEAGNKSWGGAIEGFFDPDDLGQAPLENGAIVSAVFQPIIGYTISGLILITGVSLPIETDGMITQSFTFEGKGLTVKANA